MLWHILCFAVTILDLQVKKCKSRIVSRELQKSLLDNFEQIESFFSRLNE
jgi:hypothetical protein